MNTQEYNRIINKYKISGSPSLDEIKSFLVKQIKKYHPDQYEGDQNKHKYEEITKELNIDLGIVKKMIAGKFHPTQNNVSQKSNTNTNTEKVQSTEEKINETVDFIKAMKTIFEKDEDFKGTLDALSETMRKCKDDSEYNKVSNILYHTLFMKYKTKFQIRLAHDNNKFRNDPHFYYHIYAKFLSEVNKLETLRNWKDALTRISLIINQYKIVKQNYIDTQANERTARGR